jgi:hypothetical protein
MVTVSGVFKSGSPRFKVDGSTWVQAKEEMQLLRWERPVERNAIVRVEVLASAEHSAPQSRNRRPRSRPLSSIAEVKRAIAALQQARLDDERRYRTMMALNFHRISKKAVVDYWATIAGPMPTEPREKE